MELERRGRVTAAHRARMPRLDLAMLLLDTYVRYPWPAASWIPLNYCALPKVLPWLAAPMRLVC